MSEETIKQPITAEPQPSDNLSNEPAQADNSNNDKPVDKVEAAGSDDNDTPVKTEPKKTYPVPEAELRKIYGEEIPDEIPEPVQKAIKNQIETQKAFHEKSEKVAQYEKERKEAEQKQEEEKIKNLDSTVENNYKAVKNNIEQNKKKDLQDIKSALENKSFVEIDGQQIHVTPENIDSIKEYVLDYYVKLGSHVDGAYDIANKKAIDQKHAFQSTQSEQAYNNYVLTNPDKFSTSENKEALEFLQQRLFYDEKNTNDFFSFLDTYYKSRKSRESHIDDAKKAHEDDINNLPQVNGGTKTAVNSADIPKTWAGINAKMHQDRDWYARNEKIIDEMDSKGLIKK